MGANAACTIISGTALHPSDHTNATLSGFNGTVLGSGSFATPWGTLEVLSGNASYQGCESDMEDLGSRMCLARRLARSYHPCPAPTDI